MNRALAAVALTLASGCSATHFIGEVSQIVQSCVDGSMPCASGSVCVDDPTDKCDPAAGGVNCPGVCQAVPTGSTWTCSDLPPQGVTCAASCNGGYRVDQSRVTCDCCGSVGCPNVDCQNVCPYGRKWDQMGCLTCDCKSSPPCPQVQCDNICPFGRVLDANGCETCPCRPPMCVTTPPPNATCTTMCMSYVVDSRGQPSCQCCDPVTCLPPPACGLVCPNGYKLDANGCQMCACAPMVSDGQCALAAGYCVSDNDCIVGGCVGELCYNPATTSGTTPCTCSAPMTGVTCGCVGGKCAWYSPATN
jgi:hypothetical protein